MFLAIKADNEFKFLIKENNLKNIDLTYNILFTYANEDYKLFANFDVKNKCYFDFSLN